jgi:hypothetical protein
LPRLAIRKESFHSLTVVNTTSIISAIVVATLLLAGCSQKPSEEISSNTKPAEPSSAGQPESVVQPKSANQPVQPAAPKVAAEAAPAVKQQAQEAFANLSQQLVESTKGGSTDALVKNVSADLGSRVGKLATSLADNATVKEGLNTAVQSLLGNKDIDAITELNKLTTANLTPEQATMAKDVYNAGAALVTQRNFSSIEGMNTDVSQLATAVWKGNYTEALTPLQKLYGQSTLTAPQKELLGATFDKYLPAGWKDTAGTVQKGLDTLKQFGK